MYRFGEWLKENRRLSGLSQVELSEKTLWEISQPAISQYEQNRSMPSIADIDHLARAFRHQARATSVRPERITAGRLGPHVRREDL